MEKSADILVIDPKLLELHNPPIGLHVIGILPSSLNNDGENIGTTCVILDVERGGQKAVVKKVIGDSKEILSRRIIFAQNEFGILKTVKDKFNVDKKVSEYGIHFMDDWSVSVKFPEVLSGWMSEEMLANGEIVLEKAVGKSLSKDGLNLNNFPPEINIAVLAAYLDFASKMEKDGLPCDVNIQRDLIVCVDPKNKKINVVRIDAGSLSTCSDRESIMQVVLLAEEISSLFDQFRAITDFSKTEAYVNSLPEENKTIESIYRYCKEQISNSVFLKNS